MQQSIIAAIPNTTSLLQIVATAPAKVFSMATGDGEESSVRRGDAAAKEWAAERSESFGEAVKFFRGKLELSAVELSNRTREIGYPITRGTLAKIESNSRNSKMDVSEVLVLAAALQVVPADLIFFEYPGKQIRVTPRTRLHANIAWDWLIGGPSYNQFADIHNPRTLLTDEHKKASDHYFQALDAFESRRKPQEPAIPKAQYWFADPLLTQNPNTPEEQMEHAKFAGELEMLEELQAQVIYAGGYVELPKWWNNYDFAPF